MCLRLNVNEIFITLAREFQSNSQVILQDIVLLEFKCTVYIQSHACQVFIGPWAYGIILGQDFLQKIRFHINLDNNTMNYLDKSVLLWSPDYFSDCPCLFNIMFSDDEEVDSFASANTNSTYHPVSISTIVDTQKHLSVKDRKILYVCLKRY